MIATRIKCPNCNKALYVNEIIYNESIDAELCPYCSYILPDDYYFEDPYKNGYCESCNNNVNGVCCYIGEACNNIDHCDDHHDWGVE